MYYLGLDKVNTFIIRVYSSFSPRLNFWFLATYMTFKQKWEFLKTFAISSFILLDMYI